MTAAELISQLSKIKDKENTDVMLNTDGMWANAIYIEEYPESKTILIQGD